MSSKNANNVDQIRELIFGQQIKEFESRFAKLSAELQSVEEKLSARLDEGLSRFNRETQRALEALDQKIDNQAETARKDRAKLKELLDSTDEALQTQVRNVKNELLNKLKISRENLEDETGKLRSELEQLRRDLEEMLARRLDGMDEEKVSRGAMAEMFVEMAMHLQGSDIQTLIPEQESDTEAKQ